jgi:dihydrofolate reductase
MITLIAAVSENGIIGDSALDSMPWHCKDELRQFKAITMGGTLVMGRVTAEQVGKLPGREAIVLSRDPEYKLDGFTTMSTEKFLLESEAAAAGRYYICGGAEIYKQLAPHCDNMVISYMKFECGGDVAFPDIDFSEYFVSNYTMHDEFDTHFYYNNRLK